MALPVIILRNTTVSDITLRQLAVTVPASGSITVSNFDFTYEILNDIELQGFLDSGDIEVTVDGDVLTSGQSQAKIAPLHGLDILHNLTAVVDPGVSDDDTAGYSVGSVWVNTNTVSSFRCVDDSTGAAVWEASGSPVGGGDQLIFGADSVSTTTTIRYITPSYKQDIAGTSPGARYVVTRSGTLLNMYINQTGDGNGNNLTYTLRVNGTPTLLSVLAAAQIQPILLQ
jgi:hypothetical protein